MTDLFEVPEQAPAENPLRNVAYSVAYLPSICPKCGAATDEPICYRSYCGWCDNDPETDTLEWHEYVQRLLDYHPKEHGCHPKIRKLAADLLAEREKLTKYIGIMLSSNPDFDAEAAVNTANQKARAIVQEFEEKMWEGTL